MEWCGTSSSRRRHPRHRQSTGSSSRSISWTGHDHVVSSPSFFYITTKRLLLFFIIVVVVIFSGGVLQTTASPPQSISLEPSRNQSDSTGSSMPPYATEDLKDTPMDIPDRLNFTPSDSVDWMQYTKDFRFIDISLPGTLHSAMHKIVKPEDETTGILTPVAGSFSNSSSVTPVTASPRYNGVNDLSPVSTTASSDGFRTGRAVNYAPPTFLPESNVWIKESEEETPVIVNGRKPL